MANNKNTGCPGSILPTTRALARKEKVLHFA